jgi:hypothetical protein
MDRPLKSSRSFFTIVRMPEQLSNGIRIHNLKYMPGRDDGRARRLGETAGISGLATPGLLRIAGNGTAQRFNAHSAPRAVGPNLCQYWMAAGLDGVSFANSDREFVNHSLMICSS